MGSKTIERIAIEKLLNPTISVEKLALKHGLSPSYAKTGQITASKTYKDIMAKDTEDNLKGLSILRKKALLRAKKTIASAKITEAVGAYDVASKNIQLLTGGSTGEQPVIKIVLFGDTLIAPVIETK